MDNILTFDDLPDELILEILVCQNPRTLKVINKRINELYQTYHNLIWDNFIAATNNIYYLALSVIYEPGILGAILLSKYCSKEFIHSQIPDYHSSYKGKGHSILHIASEHSPESTRLISEYCDDELFNKEIFERYHGVISIPNNINACNIAAKNNFLSFKYLITSQHCTTEHLKTYIHGVKLDEIIIDNDSSVFQYLLTNIDKLIDIRIPNDRKQYFIMHLYYRLKEKCESLERLGKYYPKKFDALVTDELKDW